MELNAAKNLLEKVFSSSYSRENFKQLIAEIFNGYDRKEQSIHQKSFDVKNFINLGLYEDNKGKKIAVYEVELLNAKSLHHARVAQRNLIASQLKSYDYDSALISFYCANHNEWRVSFITRESSIDIDADKLKFIEHLTPARRKSFIAGLNEGSHTAKKQFLERLQSTDKPSFDEIASIFMIEAVNDDFYEQYKELYLKLTEELKSFIEGDEVIAEDFKNKEVSASDFAKKTLGQFVFLYFIQRKGWIKDKDSPDKKFSFNILFDNKDSYGDNFFNDIMEPIFYELLAKKDPNFEKYTLLKHYEFPYLNGGLFEPIRGYDWEKTSIMISDEFFKNKNKTKDGDIGDGLFDVFNRFNFTIYENDPLEQDIAVDPEMLGKVFENLLSIKDRKSKGAFYTPREIVQYMCQESLANFLDTKIGDEIPLETLKFFIKNHSILEAKDIKGMGLETLAENVIALDQLLENIKVCDPAVGSGAFPMGMLSEIVGARNFLQPFLSDKQNIYDLKLHTIGQSLYGVDLDPSAVDIARLRFWLSLIIEEDMPTPLPNLEHKIMQGNSLLSSYEGEELFNDQLLVNEDSRKEKLTIIDKEVKALEKELKDGTNTINIPRIQAIKKHLIRLGKRKIKIEAEHTTTHVTQELFENDDTLSKIRKKVDLLQSKISQFLLLDESSDKEDLKNEIENIKWDLIEASVDSEGKEKAFQQLKNKRIQPFFLWKLEFIDVFRNNNGFDIVIGNPPYIQLQKTIDEETKTKLGDLYESSKYETFAKTGDIYALFYELGIKLLKDNGHLSLITSNKWLRANYGSSLRSFFLKYNAKQLIDFSGNKIFKTATVDVNILLIQKAMNKDQLIAGVIENDFDNKIKLAKYCSPLNQLTSDSWLILSDIQKSIKDKIESIGTPLKSWDISFYYGIKTGYNEAFIIEQEKRDELVREDPKSEEIIKPFVRGRDIDKYSFKHNGNYLINTFSAFENINGKYIASINIKNFPFVKRHLDNFLGDLEKRYDKGDTPYNLRSCSYLEEFDKYKVAFPAINRKWSFPIIDQDFFILAPMRFFTAKNSDTLFFLRAVIASKLYKFYWKCFANMQDDNGYQMDTYMFEKLFIPKMTDVNMKFYSNLVREMQNKKDLVEINENTIDEALYKIFDLNTEEITAVESN